MFDWKIIEARRDEAATFLEAVRDGTTGNSGFKDLLNTARYMAINDVFNTLIKAHNSAQKTKTNTTGT